MHEIIYYKDVKDIFDIGEPDGISIYSINRDIHNEKIITNKCIKNNTFESMPEIHREKRIMLSTKRIGNIVDKVQSNKLLDKLYYKSVMPISEYGHPTKGTGEVKIVNGSSGNYAGYATCEKLSIVDIQKYKVYIHCMTSQGSNSPFDTNGQAVGMKKVFIANPNEVPQGNYKVLMMFDKKEEAKSFVSFCSTRFVKFLNFVGLSASREVLENWRFVPDPGAFDKIYEDAPLVGYIPDENGEYTDNNGNKHCALYIKYKLSQEEVNIIESVIKERK